MAWCLKNDKTLTEQMFIKISKIKIRQNLFCAGFTDEQNISCAETQAISYHRLSGELWYLQHNCVGDTVVATEPFIYYAKISSLCRRFTYIPHKYVTNKGMFRVKEKTIPSLSSTKKPLQLTLGHLTFTPQMWPWQLVWDWISQNTSQWRQLTMTCQ